ncbi:MAG: MBL fold metallo-hydrolase [Steroidobacteraceae bacterium]|jgi:glyoxylase-like metal-dependent hydrolase (beta-lactamase superfamily II)|nr:MBL fold metallo-hydrolase [Steroidobacteraceae bacterium]
MTLFRQLYDPRMRAFTYLLADEASREAVAVDPEPEGSALSLLGLVRELELRLVLLLCTHAHAAAPSAVRQVRERTGARVVAGEGAPVEADLRVGDGDRLAFGGEVVNVLATPGHTPACVSYLWRDRVFTGDSLLIRGCGRTDLPGGDSRLLFDSVTRRLLVLPGETLLFPGHETHHRTVSTIAEERDCNACFAGRSRDEFITLRSAATDVSASRN